MKQNNSYYNDNDHCSKCDDYKKESSSYYKSGYGSNDCCCHKCPSKGPTGATGPTAACIL